MAISNTYLIGGGVVVLLGAYYLYKKGFNYKTLSFATAEQALETGKETKSALETAKTAATTAANTIATGTHAEAIKAAVAASDAATAAVVAAAATHAAADQAQIEAANLTLNVIKGNKPLVDFTKLGNYKDTIDRAMTDAGTLVPGFNNNYGQWLNNPVGQSRCADLARAQGARRFGVQNGGWCSIEKAGQQYDKYGASDNTSNYGVSGTAAGASTFGAFSSASTCFAKSSPNT